MNHQLKIKLKFYPLPGGKQMQASLCHLDERFEFCPNANNDSELAITVSLPTSVELLFGGKDMQHDTILDHNGNISQDLHVVIASIALDGFEASKNFLMTQMTLTTQDGNVIRSNYIGMNGKVTLDLSEKTVFKQVMNWLTNK